MTETPPDESREEKQTADDLETELLDAMRNLRRKNRKIEEYLDGLARNTEKPAQEGNSTPEK